MKVNLDVLVAQLVAARAQIDATLATLGVTIETDEQVETGVINKCPNCGATGQMVSVSTFGDEGAHLCLNCNTKSTHPITTD